MAFFDHNLIVIVVFCRALSFETGETIVIEARQERANRLHTLEHEGGRTEDVEESCKLELEELKRRHIHQLRQVMLRQEEKKEKLFSKHKDEKGEMLAKQKKEEEEMLARQKKKRDEAMKYKPAAAKQPPGAPECPV